MAATDTMMYKVDTVDTVDTVGIEVVIDIVVEVDWELVQQLEMMLQSDCVGFAAVVQLFAEQFVHSGAPHRILGKDCSTE